MLLIVAPVCFNTIVLLVLDTELFGEVTIAYFLTHGQKPLSCLTPPRALIHFKSKLYTWKPLFFLWSPFAPRKQNLFHRSLAVYDIKSPNSICGPVLKSVSHILRKKNSCDNYCLYKKNMYMQVKMYIGSVKSYLV